MTPQVEYASLPNFEEREEDFRAESVILRRRFTEDGVPPLQFELTMELRCNLSFCALRRVAERFLKENLSARAHLRGDVGSDLRLRGDLAMSVGD